MSDEDKSYRQVLRSSSVMGGAQALTYIIGLVRIKIVAMLLGPSGIGLVGLYASAMGLIGTVSGLGIASSGVREVVQAYSHEDAARAARTVRILRRACWATGVLGWLLAIAVAQPVSQWMFGSPDHAWAIAVLGVTLLIGSVSAGQLALLQGLRRIGDMARASVLSALVSSAVAIALYAWLGQDGVVPVLVASALVSLGFSYWFSKRVAVSPVTVSWADTLVGTRRLAGLGVAFMWSGVLTAGVDMLTRSVITRQHGLEAAGIYQAAWALSGLFAGFILGAMGADFYPRLTAVIHDKVKAAKAVNEQTEIGVLLALPGLLATIAFAPLVIEVFYTKRFLPGAELLPWLVIGVLGRVISWPMGFIQMAMGASRWFVATETIFIGLQATFVLWMVPAYGAVGAAYAFALTYALYVMGMLWVSRMLIDFRWSSAVLGTLSVTVLLVMGALAARLLWSGGAGVAVMGGLTLVALLFSVHGLVRRTGGHSQWARRLASIPGIGRLYKSVLDKSVG